MIPSCFQETLQDFHMYEGMEGMPPLASSDGGSGGGGPGLLDAQIDTLLYSVSLLGDRIQQVRALVGTLVVSADQFQSVAMAIESVGSLAQEIMAAALAILPTIQQSALHAALVPAGVFPMDYPLPHDMGGVSGAGIHYSINQSNSTGDHRTAGSDDPPMAGACDIVELDAVDLLAMHTHYCPVCGKGFKRGANLRMHMRAHGDEYKAAGALSNPVKRCGNIGLPAPRKYSCPQDGCRWNSGHARFQPLKSMVCVRRHYRRSHCPKMYVCRRCGGKRFSLLSDLRSHEKHCGRLRRWRCSCGTTFSRKDKLMGHVALFLGHAPDPSCFKNPGEPEFEVMQA